MPNKQDAVKAVALTAAGLALLTACGEPKATPMNDEYAGNSGESVQSQEEESQKDSGSSGSSDDTVKNHDDDPNSTKSDNKDTGNYADGTYKINGQYGPVGEDTIDVKLTIKQGNVENVDIVGHPFTSISRKQTAQRAENRQDSRSQLDLRSIQQSPGGGSSGSLSSFGILTSPPVAAKLLPSPTDSPLDCPLDGSARQEASVPSAS